jgi:metal-responsive CopG/Arc/MetJ family transcriptional regulator
MPKKYGSPRIPKALFDEAEKFINEHPELGYRSVSELLTDLLRRKLEDIKSKKSL